ncbi:MAG: M42 family metallopeptidase [Chloroflexi bacterium]|nr:M42 family metallopeptidase [Chloroflexota bacterium]
MVDFLVQLLKTPSPTGYTAHALHLVRETLATLKLDTRFNTKGGLIATWQGKSNTRGRALTAHVDTLGAMVKEIDNATGRLRLSKIGGLTWPSVEGETCSIITNSGHIYRGTILPRKASVHVHSGLEVERGERSDASMELRLDAKVRSGAETYQLGIEVGDFVAFDPRTEVTDTGFIRSRHLDDKASVACIVTACKALLDAGQRPAQRTTLLISHYEEVGHGASTGIPADVKEVLAVDMAAVGIGQNSDEYSVGICVKDSGGPYSLEMKQMLMQLCQNADIPYKLDIYPFYGSDVGPVWRSGADVVAGLIGPGVDASHHYERTHVDSLVATVRLIIEFMLA